MRNLPLSMGTLRLAALIGTVTVLAPGVCAAQPPAVTQIPRTPNFPLTPIIPEMPVEPPGLAGVSGLDAGLYDAEGLTPDERVNVLVYEKVNRSVVNITAAAIERDGLVFQTLSEGNGSGVVIDAQGHIVTNFHVAKDAVGRRTSVIAVTLYDGSSYEATFVGADRLNDLAVLKIDAKPELLYPVEVGDSTRLRVGMRVFAIGNPFGFERTLSTGVVSSLNRSLDTEGNRKIKSIIQIDASVNPGNSGGPLLDSHGRLIGITTAIATKTGQSAGVGFAIPSSLVTRVIPQLIERGRVTRSEIGLAVYETTDGLLIAYVTPGGPAERAGLRGPAVIESRRGPFVVKKTDRTAADLIVELDGQKVTSGDDFFSDIEAKRPGDVVRLTVRRGGRSAPVDVTLGAVEDPVN